VLGSNVCIFAYGQTGSGKTYTMSGGDDAATAGIIPRAVARLFEQIAGMARRGWHYDVSVSFLEIYNESIRDLLAKHHANGSSPPRCEIKRARDGSQIVTNLTHETVASAGDLASLLTQANTRRATSASEMNERSSRSHSVCQIVVRGMHEVSGETCQAKLSMIDLAGSERLNVPNPAEIAAAPIEARIQLQEEVAKRTAETLHINKSLSTLAQVMQAIRAKSAHVPYRDSKLTYFLQDTLCAEGKSLMIVNVSPRNDCLTETVCSLRFAAKVSETTISASGRSP